MSRGSTFTLYRAYTNFKADDSVMSALKEEYYQFNKKQHYLSGFFFDSMTEEQKAAEMKRLDERDREDIPAVMELDFKRDRKWDCDEKNKSLAELRRARFENYVLRDTGVFMDKLLDWGFSSTFDCLVSEFSLNSNLLHSCVVIDEATARKMLEAIEYLLGGKYDSNLEASMDNRFIKVFSEGGNCDSYWKYVYRNRYDKNRSEYEFSDPSGVSVKVRLPNPPAKKEVSDEEDDEDWIYSREIEESNEEQECHMRRTAEALRAFLNADEWSWNDDTKLVLVYSYWC